MTRFTEEGFSSLISFIFISDAIKKMVGNMLMFAQMSLLSMCRHFWYMKQTVYFPQIESFKYYPINRGFKPDYITAYKCECIAPDQGKIPKL